MIQCGRKNGHFLVGSQKFQNAKDSNLHVTIPILRHTVHVGNKHRTPPLYQTFFRQIGHDNSLCSLYTLNNKSGNYM